MGRTPSAREENMKILDIIQTEQSEFINNIFSVVRKYIDDLNKNNLQTIMLSGSVSRGDYNPGKFGGKIDLIVMKKPGSTVTPEMVFGEDDEPDIPFHCITVDKYQYQILFIEFVDYSLFQTFDEARKNSFLESQILYDLDNKYQNELTKIVKFAYEDQITMLNNCLGYIGYLLSEYKKDRWYRRQSFVQMHENLNTSIRLLIQCIYYVNGKYAPAEDRRLYYTFSLAKLPTKYEEKIVELYRQDISSEDDYVRRENLFNSVFLGFIKENRPTTAST